MNIAFMLVVVIGVNASPDHTFSKLYADYERCSEAATEVKGQLDQLSDENKLLDWTGSPVDKVDIEVYCTPQAILN